MFFADKEVFGMIIEVKSFENWFIVSLDGKFIVKYLSQIRKAIEPLEKMDLPLIAFDLSATTHMDSSAITLIMNYNKELLLKNGKLVLFGANEDITGIINIVGLDAAVPLYKTQADFELSVRLNNI
jgi:anti-anti-sigma factor